MKIKSRVGKKYEKHKLANSFIKNVGVKNFVINAFICQIFSQIKTE